MISLGNTLRPMGRDMAAMLVLLKLSQYRRADEAADKGPCVYYSCSQPYLLEDSAAYSDEQNKNATGGAITIGAVIYDALPMTEETERILSE